LEFRLKDLNQWTPHVSGSWRYIASQYSTLSTAPQVGLMPAYWWVDIDLRMTKGHYDVSLYAKNLFDKRAPSARVDRARITRPASALSEASRYNCA
jgi:outer membrane receptor protein involved in Fe transport